MILDSKLNFVEHLKTISVEVDMTIGLLDRLQKTLPKQLILTIYISFNRPHLDYDDVIFDQSFHQKPKYFQQNEKISYGRAIRGNTKELESLQNPRWYRKPSCFCNFFTSQSPGYLFNLIPRNKNLAQLEALRIFHY